MSGVLRALALSAAAAVLCACASYAPADPKELPPSDYTPAVAAPAPGPEEARPRLIELLSAARWLDLREGDLRCELTDVSVEKERVVFQLKDRTTARVASFAYGLRDAAPHLKKVKDGWAIVRLPPFFVEKGLSNERIRPAMVGALAIAYDEKGSARAAELVDLLESLRAAAAF